MSCDSGVVDAYAVHDVAVARQTLSRFALTHEEIVARRRMLPRGHDSQRNVSNFNLRTHTHTHTNTRLTALCPGTTRASRYEKGKTNLDFTEATDSEWRWHQLGHMQVCTSLQTDNHASTPPLSFYRAFRAMLCIRGTSHGPVSVCVCLSQAGVLLKRQNVGSHKQHHTIPQGL